MKLRQQTISQNMHAAILRTASSAAKLLPCMCTDITNGKGFELAKSDPVTNSKEERYLLKIQIKV